MPPAGRSGSGSTRDTLARGPVVRVVTLAAIGTFGIDGAA